MSTTEPEHYPSLFDDGERFRQAAQLLSSDNTFLKLLNAYHIISANLYFIHCKKPDDGRAEDEEYMRCLGDACEEALNMVWDYSTSVSGVEMPRLGYPLTNPLIPCYTEDADEE